MREEGRMRVFITFIPSESNAFSTRSSEENITTPDPLPVMTAL